jgi:hypothetical protein
MMQWLGILSVLQTGNLLVFCTFRVEHAARGDITSRMIESHRLMPAPPLGSIFGYLFGAPLQGMLLAGVTFAAGMACCTIGGINFDSWIFLNAALYFFAVFVHTIVLQLAFVMRGGFLLLLFVGFFLMSLGGSGALDMVPSLSFLFFPILSRWSVYVAMFTWTSPTNTPVIVYTYGAAFAAQAILAAVAIRVSVRRYLSSSAIGITPLLGLIILATWVALAEARIALPDGFVADRGFSAGEEVVTRTVCSIASSMLLALVPIASAAKSANVLRRGGQRPARFPFGQFSEIWTVIIAVAIMAVLLRNVSVFGDGDYIDPSAYKTGLPGLGVMLVTAFIVANFSVSIACLFSFGYRRVKYPWIIVLMWVGLTWIGPVVVDAVYQSLSNNLNSPTTLTAVSPPGALALLWSNSRVPLQWGMVGQGVITAVAAGLLMLSRRKGPVRRTGQRSLAPAAV